MLTLPARAHAVVQLCKPGRLETTIDLLHEFMLELGFDKPKIALGGLNPHCGDGDIYGVTEEKTVMEPCIKKCNTKPGSVSRTFNSMQPHPFSPVHSGQHTLHLRLPFSPV